MNVVCVLCVRCWCVLCAGADQCVCECVAAVHGMCWSMCTSQCVRSVQRPGAAESASAAAAEGDTEEPAGGAAACRWLQSAWSLISGSLHCCHFDHSKSAPGGCCWNCSLTDYRLVKGAVTKSVPFLSVVQFIHLNNFGMSCWVGDISCFSSIIELQRVGEKSLYNIWRILLICLQCV